MADVLDVVCCNILLLTERLDRIGEYWPGLWHSVVCAKKTEGQYSPARLEQARLVSGLLYGTKHKNTGIRTVSMGTVCIANYYMAVYHKDWELPDSRI